MFGLNYLAGYLDASQWPLDPVNAAQHSSVNSIRSLHAGLLGACGRTCLLPEGLCLFASRAGRCSALSGPCASSGAGEAGRDARVLNRRADVLGCEIVCSTWLLARRAPAHSRMPHRLRSVTCPWGLPDLSAKDALSAARRSRMLRHAARLIKDSLWAGHSGYLENNRGSYMWIILRRIFRRELFSGSMSIEHCCLCQYGAPFKKQTSLLIWNPTTRPCFKMCTGTKGLCSRTGRRHEQFSFTSNDDIAFCIHKEAFRIRIAQVYPKPFAKDLFKLFAVRGSFQVGAFASLGRA